LGAKLGRKNCFALRFCLRANLTTFTLPVKLILTIVQLLPNPIGNQLSVRVDTGYNIKAGNAAIGLTVGVRYNRVNIDGYSEKDAGSLNRVVKSQEAESVVLSLGTQASYTIKAGDGAVIPHPMYDRTRYSTRHSREGKYR
jgi:outer membrane lipase/esterase